MFLQLIINIRRAGRVSAHQASSVMLVLDPKFKILNKVKKVTEKKDPFFRSADPQIRDPEISDPRLLNVRSRIIDLPEH